MLAQLVCLVGCILIFSRSLAAYAGGPPANRNGLTGQFCTACHRTNPLNSGEGSVRIVGLPSAWAPGESYTLRVVVSHPTAIRWGFEFSATGANGDQAGEIVPGADGRTQVITEVVNTKTVQFIEHNTVGSTIGSPSTFQFTYRAPTDATFGSIRFNVAGNAANGNGANTGDFIYATELTLPVLTPSSDRQFTLSMRGGSSTATAGATTPLLSGFARMQTSSGPAGAGLAMISYRNSGVLGSETALPASVPIFSGRSFIETGGAINTGIALANPSNQAASVSFFFTDAAGTNFGDSTITIGANSQVVAFVTEAPFRNGITPQKPITDARTFTFGSNFPLSAAVLKTRLNERGEFMMTGIPIVSLGGSSTSSTSITHMADGGGWTTELLLVNRSDTVASGSMQFYASSGQSLNVNLDGQTANQFFYSIPARSARRFRTGGSTSTTSTGWIQIAPDANTQTPSAAALLSARANNVTISETIVAASAASSTFRIYAELSGDFSSRQAGSTQTGVAISNPGSTAVSVSIDATNLDGTVAASTSLSIPARGQFGLLLADIPQLKLPTPFTGVLWISAPAGSSISVGGLRARFNERQTPDLLVSAFPAFDEAAVSASELIFPQIVHAGGYSTQFALMGVRSAQSAGTLRFVSQAGQPLQLPVR